METRHSFSRRKLLALSAATGAGLAIGSASPASAHNVVQYNTIWNQPTYYENLNTGTAVRTNFEYNTAFHSQLDAWMQDWYGYTPTLWVSPIQIWSNGVHGDKPGMHMYGRAMDISRLLAQVSGLGTTITAFYSRYDIWRNWSGDSLYNTRRWYWGTVASLNAHCGVVLHYLYNTEHHNHIHADNSEPNTFNRSTSQVLMVQAALSYIWGYPTSMDGVWGGQSDTNSRAVLARIGKSGGLTTSFDNWRSFCMVSLAQATGRFTY
ncbi:hypothetical protein Rhe02_16150 [Rhizocola hellebori]|uniref:Uncharacterized protein n=1 Tax=Rhizocola hellebori TaxID=1392758 RepID=A0A8J3Q594_9ACTN|nr:hypothetical protein [Rhizocola hellebori]GIH03548.1 hypothetical protein Rhe02_16150 [Rhizocola hellebori]